MVVNIFMAPETCRLRQQPDMAVNDKHGLLRGEDHPQ